MPLYSMPEFFRHVDTDVVLGTNCPPDALNDARLAAALDHVFDAGTDTVFGRIVHTYLGREEVPAECSTYLDTSSISLQGAYDVVPAEGAPTPLRDFSKDHRPDLKQLIFGMSVHGAVGIPLTMSTMDGNTADKTTNQWNIEELASLLPSEHDVTVVGDSKLVDAVTFGQLLDEGMHFLSLVPLTFAIRSELVEVRVAGDGRVDPTAPHPARHFRPHQVGLRWLGRTDRQITALEGHGGKGAEACPPTVAG